MIKFNRVAIQGMLLFCMLFTALPGWAHHVLGRPAYSWNEDSSTPPTMEMETQLGRYAVSIMIFPAFPKKGEESRIKLYATSLDTHESFAGPVRFSIRDDVWFGDAREEELGVQEPLDGIHRQIMVFSEEADYIVRAEFTDKGEPYIVDLPVSIGLPNSRGWTPLIAAGVIGAVLLWVNIKKKRRRSRAKPVSSSNTASLK